MDNLIKYSFDCMFFPPLEDGSIDTDHIMAYYLPSGQELTRDELFETFGNEPFLYAIPFPDMSDAITKESDNIGTYLFDYLDEHYDELLENKFEVVKTYH